MPRQPATCIRIPRELRAAVKAAADAKGRTFSAMVCEILKAWVRKDKGK